MDGCARVRDSWIAGIGGLRLQQGCESGIWFFECVAREVEIVPRAGVPPVQLHRLLEFADSVLQAAGFVPRESEFVSELRLLRLQTHGLFHLFERVRRATDRTQQHCILMADTAG